MKQRHSKAKLRMSGDPILSIVCEPVKDNENINHITRDMSHILYKIKTGVGLSANQAGYTKRIIIIRYKSKFEILINPEILSTSNETVTKLQG